MNRKNKKDRMKRGERIFIRKKIHAMVGRVYLYLKEEYNFMKMCNTDGCNIKPLSNCRQRTAIATGTSAKGVRLGIRVQKEEQEVQKRNPTKILNDDDEDCLLIEDDKDCIVIEDDKGERQNIEKRKIKELSRKHRIVKKIKKDNSHTNTTDTENSDSSTNANSSSNENLIEISESDKEEHKRLSPSSKSTDNEESSSSSKSIDNEDDENLSQIALFENVVAERSNQVNLNTASNNNEEDGFPSTSSHQAECNILFSSIKNSVQQSTRQVRPYLQRITQFKDKITQNSEQVDVATVIDINENLANDNEESRQFPQLEDEVTENNRCVEFPSTCIKQEKFETLPLSTYTANVDEGLLSSILKCKAEVTENNVQVNADTDTYYMIQEAGCPNPSVKLEEYEVITSSSTYMDLRDFKSDEGQLFCSQLDSVRQFQDKVEVTIDTNVEHVTSIEQGDYKILSSNFAVNVAGKGEIEDEQELDPLSNMKQDYYILEIEKEENIDVDIDRDDTSVDEDLPSSSNSNLYKASDTKDIEFVCVNEASSDSSD